MSRCFYEDVMLTCLHRVPDLTYVIMFDVMSVMITVMMYNA